MSSCNNLINELKKCLLEKKEVCVEQIVIIPKLSYFDDLDTEYNHYKTNIFKLNDKLFTCEENDNIKQYLDKNNLQISKEDYPNMSESTNHKNIITIKKQK